MMKRLLVILNVLLISHLPSFSGDGVIITIKNISLIFLGL